MYGDDWMYASTRLNGTVVRVGVEPVVVNEVRGVDLVDLTYLRSGERCVKSLRELNVKPVPLGFVNDSGECTYVARMPRRSNYRQGLRGDNTLCLYGKSLPSFMSVSVANTIVGSYPSLGEALSSGSKSVAWSRHWAITNTGVLLYKAKGEVGRINGGMPELHPKYSYLNECLQEALL